MNAESSLLVEREPPIGWVVVNRPEAHNALNADVWRQLAARIESFGSDDEVRVIVVRGAGDRAFISGADINEFDQVRADSEAERGYDDLSNRAWRALESVPKPVIAMINGLCYGGGVSVAVSCDIRIAADTARMAIPALRLGLAYPLVAVERLVRIVGSATASEMLLTGEVLTAEAARTAGLVHRVVPQDDLESAVREVAAGMSAGAPLTLAAHKLAIREVAESGRGRDREGLSAAIRRCFDSADYREGVQAFRDKRSPQFRGK